MTRLGTSGEKLIGVNDEGDANVESSSPWGNVNSAWVNFDTNEENPSEGDDSGSGQGGFEDTFESVIESKGGIDAIKVPEKAKPHNIPDSFYAEESLEAKCKALAADLIKYEQPELSELPKSEGPPKETSKADVPSKAGTQPKDTNANIIQAQKSADKKPPSRPPPPVEADLLGWNTDASSSSKSASGPSNKDLLCGLAETGDNLESDTGGVMSLVDDFLGITDEPKVSETKKTVNKRDELGIFGEPLAPDDTGQPALDDDDFLGISISTNMKTSSSTVSGNLLGGFDEEITSEQTSGETKEEESKTESNLETCKPVETPNLKQINETSKPVEIPKPVATRSRPRPKGKTVIDLSGTAQKLAVTSKEEAQENRGDNINLFVVDDTDQTHVTQPPVEMDTSEDIFDLGSSPPPALPVNVTSLSTGVDLMSDIFQNTPSESDQFKGELGTENLETFVKGKLGTEKLETKTKETVPEMDTLDIFGASEHKDIPEKVTPVSDDFDPRSDFTSLTKPVSDPGETSDIWGDTSAASGAQFDADFAEIAERPKPANANPFADFEGSADPSAINPFASSSGTVDHDNDFFGLRDQSDQQAGAAEGLDGAVGTGFDPFATIHEDDVAFEASFSGGHTTSATPDSMPEDTGSGPTSPGRFNPFDKEPPLDEKFANFEPKVKSEGTLSTPPKVASTESSIEDESLDPIEPYYPPYTGEGWKLLLRMPLKKKLTGNRYWKPVFVRLKKQGDLPVLKIYANDKTHEAFHELRLQAAYSHCDMGLQTFDQFGKCHTVKIQYVFYRETVGVKAERLTPTFNDLIRVRNIKGLKDLVHKPKTTMILDHAPQASELVKLGGLDYDDFKQFLLQLEDAFFHLKVHREKPLTYTKDEITMDVIEEYYAAIDKGGHITFHKNRVRIFCLAFLTGMPTCELGLNDRRRQGKEVVGRHDIIPIKTEEWIRIEEPEFHSVVDLNEYEKTKVVKFKPLDGAQFELLRYRTRPRLNKELPLQIRCQMMVDDRRVEIRADVMIPGYFSNSRRAAQVGKDIIIC